MRFLKKTLLGHNILYSYSIKFHYFAGTVVCLEIEKKGWGMKEGPKGGVTLGNILSTTSFSKAKGSYEVTSIIVPS